MKTLENLPLIAKGDQDGTVKVIALQSASVSSMGTPTAYLVTWIGAHPTIKLIDPGDFERQG